MPLSDPGGDARIQSSREVRAMSRKRLWFMLVALAVPAVATSEEAVDRN
jgi:hypothetical protein